MLLRRAQQQVGALTEGATTSGRSYGERNNKWVLLQRAQHQVGVLTESATTSERSYVEGAILNGASIWQRAAKWRLKSCEMTFASQNFSKTGTETFLLTITGLKYIFNL